MKTTDIIKPFKKLTPEQKQRNKEQALKYYKKRAKNRRFPFE